MMVYVSDPEQLCWPVEIQLMNKHAYGAHRSGEIRKKNGSNWALSGWSSVHSIHHQNDLNLEEK